MVVIQYRAQEFLVKSRERQILTLQDYLSLVPISQSFWSENRATNLQRPRCLFMLCLVAPAPRWNSSNMVFLTHMRTCQSKGKKGERAFPTPLLGSAESGWSSEQLQCQSWFLTFFPTWDASTIGRLIQQGKKKETNYRFFSLLSLLMAILLLKGRMPQADVHQKPRQTTNGCRKPSTETDLLSQGELKHSSLIELPSCITRGWVQTPLLLPWGHPSSPPASTDQPNIESQVAGPSY